MKWVAYVSGILGVLILLTGSLFRFLHWPGGRMGMIGGWGVLILIFLPAALYLVFRKDKGE